MQQFDLEEWLKDKSRKVITRTGNPVRIICWDREHGGDDLPIVCLEKSNGGELLLTCKSNGRDGIFDTPYDLFFADDEDGLTEFDYAVLSIISDHNSHTDSIESFAKRSSKKLLELARKELKKKFVLLAKEDYQTAFDLGKAEALKDIPEWKKAKESRTLPDDVVKIGEDGMVIHSDMVWEGEYFITLQSLKSLPKEE